MKLEHIFAVVIVSLFDTVISQISTNIVYLNKRYENEPFYYDLSFLNSNFSNTESIQNKFSTREKNGSPNNKHSCNQIKQIPSNIRNDLRLSYFYQKYTEAYGIPVLGSNKVSTNGLRRACYVLRFYLSNRNELRENFYKRNLRVVVLATTENILNVPEYNLLPNSWSSVRGLSPTLTIPLVTVSEENLQCSNDKYKSEDLMVHELSYSLLSLDVLNSGLKTKIESAYKHAKLNVPWKNSFSLVDIKEYLASGIDIYLNSFGKKENFVFTLEELDLYDSTLLNIIREIFNCDNSYINKCKSSRDLETNQVLRFGDKCELEAVNNLQIFNIKSTTNVIQTEQVKTTQKNEINFQPRPSQNNILSAINRQPFISTSTLHFSTTSILVSTKPVQNLRKNECENLNEKCESWALKGECVRNRQYMSIECKKSCNLCDEQITKATRKIDSTKKIDISVFENFCKDEFTHCPIFALRGDCKLNPHYMLQKCMRSCNLCGDLVEQKDRIQPTSKKPSLRRPNSYLTPSVSEYESRYNYNQVSTLIPTRINPKTNPVPISTTTSVKYEPENIQTCQDQVDYCNQLAERGDCGSNEATMRFYCPKSCRFC